MNPTLNRTSKMLTAIARSLRAAASGIAARPPAPNAALPARVPYPVAAALVVSALIAPAAAEPAFEPADASVIEFGSDVAELQSVGLRLSVPVGSETTVQTLGGRVTVGISLPEELGAVLMQVRESGDKRRSVLDMERAVLRRTLYRTLSDERFNTDTEFKFETEAGVSLGRGISIPCAERIVRPFYVYLRDDSPEPMRGFGVIPLDVERFVFFQLVSSTDVFERSRQVFELMLASATLKEGGELDDVRGGLIASGAALIASLSPDDYAQVVSDIPDQFERIYRPAPGGAAADEEEVGYRRIRAWLGSQADVETGEPDPKGPLDGFVLRIDGSVLLDEDAAGTSRADSRAVYYLSNDRRQESWKVDMSVYAEGKKKPEVWSEIGVRQGRSMSVQITNSNRDSSTLRPSVGETGYISRLEAAILPKLLIRAGKAGEYAFYAYDQSDEVNRLRTATIGRAENRPGLWRVVTDLGEDHSETAEFNDYARLIRSETSDGLIKRPIEFERLYRLWQSKGLPLD